MDTGTFNTDTGAHRIYTVVVGIYSDLRFFTRNADYFFQDNRTVLNFRNLKFQKFFKEFRSRTGYNDLRF